MLASRFRHLRLMTVMVVATVFMGVAGYWYCQQDNAIAFLPAKTGAQWILNPTPPEIVAHLNTPVKNAFQCRFTLSTTATQATLTLYAFKKAAVYLNDREVPGLHRDGKNWKTAATANVANWLQTGTNVLTVWVTNDSGPPALWLRLEAEENSLSSDTNWQVSLTGQTWIPAHLAVQSIPIPRWSPLFDEVTPWMAVKNTWSTLLLFLAITLVIIFFSGRERLAGLISRIKFSPVYILLAILLIARMALFFNDVTRLPDWTSFDEPSHLVYLQYIQQHGALPPPDSGSEMHQPPLYYLIAAAATKLCGLPIEKANGLAALRAVNTIFGLLHCWLALLCLRRLFPNNSSAQIVGLLAASFLPPYLYLSLGITNDLLAGLLVTTAFYFLLRALPSNHLWPYAASGLALGAALLTKLSVLPAVPVFFIALGCHCARQKEHPLRDWLSRAGIIALLCMLVSGWHYLRIWSHTGTLALPRSDSNSWWQTPGFHTAGYYLAFGQVLVSPLFAGLSSFADGMYSTFWGDGMISGATQLVFRPPWNYDLMKAGYWLALPLTFLVLAGITAVIRRDLKAEGWFIIGMIFIYALAIIGVTLLGPWQSQVKAFYAIPAFLPVCASIAAGWDWLANRSQTWRTVLWILVLMWSLTTFASFWINDRSAEFWRSRALIELRQQHFGTAATAAKEALRLNPNDFESHCLLASIYVSQKQDKDAIQQYMAALKINPDSPKLLDTFALMQLNGEKEVRQQAVRLAERACELTSYQNAAYLTTLALAYANIGENQAAIHTAENAAELARLNGDTDVLKQNQELIERCRPPKAPPAD